MIKYFNKKLNWDAKYIPNLRIVKFIGTGQLEVPDPTGRLKKVNICVVHKVLPSDFISDEKVFARKGKYINDPCILKEVMVIDPFFPRQFHKH